ncbi:Zinc transporter ZIP13 [Polyplax serrata]|uniref:Zinc transporter ZIP13 n=1 Tax=Polyplax serrata TaxID=468196 RepID=A0AAN8P5T5_POLSC
MLIFIIVEKLCSSLESEKMVDVPMVGKGKAIRKATSLKDFKSIQESNKKKTTDSNLINNNNDSKNGKLVSETKGHYHISGYLNLMANSVDNFTHGLAIGGSFSISFKMGLLSTFAILVHELPHEIGDFAILLKSGFSRWDAAKAQICTAFAGIVGSMLAVVYGSSDSLESKTSWILPFTAGGFLHIALVTVLPELVNEESKSESCKQLGSLVFGIGIMAFMIAFFG